jgi:hypothetical protein
MNKPKILTLKHFLLEKPFVLELIVGIVSGLFLLIATQKFGLGYTNDSINYMRIAENIWLGEGFYYSNGVPFVRYAPLYPMLLSISHLFGVDTLTFARAIHIFLYGFFMAILVYWFRRLGNSGFTLILGSIILLGSRPIFMMSSKLWTELFFIILSSIFIISFSKYLACQDKRRVFFAISIFSVMLACLMRYIGITLILTGSILILVKSSGWKTKISDLFAFGFLSSLPTGFFVLRNYWLTSTLIGDRYPSNRSIWFILSNVTTSISNLFIPAIFPKIILIISFFPIIITLIVMMIWIMKHSKDRPYLIWCVSSAITFSSIYIFYLIFSAKMVGFNSLLTRFFSVVYIPIVLIFLIYLTLLYDRKGSTEESITKQSKNSQLLKKVFSVVIFLVSIFLVSTIGYYTYYYYENSPGGLGDPEIRESEMVSYVLKEKPEGKLYTNIPNAFFSTELDKKVHYYPRKTYEASDVSPDDLPQFNKTLKYRDSAVIIWFDIDHDYLFPIDELKTMYEFRIIREFRDGIVYRVFLN